MPGMSGMLNMSKEKVTERSPAFVELGSSSLSPLMEHERARSKKAKALEENTREENNYG
jgi:hypothetical protein